MHAELIAAQLKIGTPPALQHLLDGQQHKDPEASPNKKLKIETDPIEEVSPDKDQARNLIFEAMGPDRQPDSGLQATQPCLESLADRNGVLDPGTGVAPPGTDTNLSHHQKAALLLSLIHI